MAPFLPGRPSGTTMVLHITAAWATIKVLTCGPMSAPSVLLSITTFSHHLKQSSGPVASPSLWNNTMQVYALPADGPPPPSGASGARRCKLAPPRSVCCHPEQWYAVSVATSPLEARRDSLLAVFITVIHSVHHFAGFHINTKANRIKYTPLFTSDTSASLAKLHSEEVLVKF